MKLPEPEVLNALVTPIFRVNDVTLGDGKEYYFRYRGQLAVEDSVAAYDQLAAALRPYELLPLFRKEDDGGQLIYIVTALPKPRPFSAWVNVVLFILTVFSVMFAGAEIPASAPVPADLGGQLLLQLRYIFTGWRFSLSLMSILLAHELGHYFMSRYHKTSATLPYFIPFPLPPLGTMGAVISMNEPPKNKRILLDIGIAGPLAGLVVAIPVLLYGLSISHLGPIEKISGMSLEGNSLLYLLAKYLIFGKLLPAPVDYGGLGPFLYWLRYFFTGSPIPFGGTDVFVSPVAFAGWAGLLVTALNLIPAGQLDGGHMLYVLFGKRLRLALPAILVILGGLGFFWPGWWLWLGILYLFGRAYAEPLDQITEIDPPRRALAILGIIIFFLVFIPIPFVQYIQF
jgi:membrane-associated protease RseP (regulator of RpoE activity)